MTPIIPYFDPLLGKLRNSDVALISLATLVVTDPLVVNNLIVNSNASINTLKTISISNSSTITSNLISTNGIVASTATIGTAHISNIEWNLTSGATVVQEGQMTWDSVQQTTVLGMAGSNVNVALGMEQLFPRRVRNSTGSTMAKGTVVYINGVSGNTPTVARAIATSDSTSAFTLGMTAENINDGSTGWVTTFGELTGINLSSFTGGDTLYLSGATAGAFTNIPQSAPIHYVRVGTVVKATADGALVVNVLNGYELQELHNVVISSLASGQILQSGASSLWYNVNPAFIPTASYPSLGSLAIMNQLSYNSLLNLPSLGSLAFQNNISLGSLAVMNTLSYASLTGKPSLGSLAEMNSLSYGSLLNLPSLGSLAFQNNISLGSLAVMNSLSYGSITNLPSLGSLAEMNALSFTSLLNQPSLSSLAYQSTIDYTSNQLINKPSLGSLAQMNQLSFTSLTNQPSLSSLAFQSTVPYTQITGTPSLGSLAEMNQLSYTSLTNKPSLGSLAEMNSLSFASLTNQPSLSSLAFLSSVSQIHLPSTASYDVLYTKNLTNASNISTAVLTANVVRLVSPITDAQFVSSFGLGGMNWSNASNAGLLFNRLSYFRLNNLVGLNDVEFFYANPSTASFAGDVNSLKMITNQILASGISVGVIYAGTYQNLPAFPSLGSLAIMNQLSYTSLTNLPSLGSLAQMNQLSFTSLTNQPSLSSLAFQATIDYTSAQLTNKPSLGSLAEMNQLSFTSLTNQPSLSSLAFQPTVDYPTQVLNKPSLGSLANMNQLSFTSLTNQPSLSSLAFQATIDYNTSQILNKPALGSLAPMNQLSFTSLTDQPSLASLAFLSSVSQIHLPSSASYSILYTENLVTASGISTNFFNAIDVVSSKASIGTIKGDYIIYGTASLNTIYSNSVLASLVSYYLPNLALQSALSVNSINANGALISAVSTGFITGQNLSFANASINTFYSNSVLASLASYYLPNLAIPSAISTNQINSNIVYASTISVGNITGDNGAFASQVSTARINTNQVLASNISTGILNTLGIVNASNVSTYEITAYKASATLLSLGSTGNEYGRLQIINNFDINTNDSYPYGIFQRTIDTDTVGYDTFGGYFETIKKNGADRTIYGHRARGFFSPALVSEVLSGVQATSNVIEVVNNGTVNYAETLTTNATITNSRIGELRLLRLYTPTLNGTGTINTLYGINIANVSIVASNYAIFSEGGDSYHAGAWKVGTYIQSNVTYAYVTERTPSIGDIISGATISTFQFSPSNAELQFVRANTSTAGPQVILKKARGNASGPTLNVTGDDIGMFRFYSYVSTSAGGAYDEVARITVDTVGQADAGAYRIYTALTSTTVTEKLTIMPNGYIGFSNSNPSYRLQLPTTATGAGTGYAYAWTATSDRNLKENITQLENALDTIKRLRGVNFTWKDGGKEDTGVIAQEVKEVLPQIVMGGEGSYGVDYSKFAPFLIEAIKEQQKIIDDLKARIEVLENSS